MADFLTRLAGRTMGLAPTVHPIIAPMYVPAPVIAGDQSARMVLDAEAPGNLIGQHRVSPSPRGEVPQGFSEQDNPLVEVEYQVGAGLAQETPLLGASMHGHQDKLGKEYRTSGLPTEKRQELVEARFISSVTPVFPDRGHDESSEHLSSVQALYPDAPGHAQPTDTLPKPDLLAPASGNVSPSTFPAYLTEDTPAVQVEAGTASTHREQRRAGQAVNLSETSPDEYELRSEQADVSGIQSTSPSIQRPGKREVVRPQITAHQEHTESSLVEQRQAVTESSSAAPTIQVNIGRIEVRAIPPPTPRPQNQRSAPAVMSLDDYLSQHARGGH